MTACRAVVHGVAYVCATGLICAKLARRFEAACGDNCQHAIEAARGLAGALAGLGDGGRCRGLVLRVACLCRRIGACGWRLFPGWAGLQDVL